MCHCRCRLWPCSHVCDASEVEFVATRSLVLFPPACLRVQQTLQPAHTVQADYCNTFSTPTPHPYQGESLSPYQRDFDLQQIHMPLRAGPRDCEAPPSRALHSPEQTTSDATAALKEQDHARAYSCNEASPQKRQLLWCGADRRTPLTPGWRAREDRGSVECARPPCVPSATRSVVAPRVHPAATAIIGRVSSMQRSHLQAPMGTM